jgi:hypothetical protein
MIYLFIIKASYVGAPVQFQFDTIANNLSILSSRCVVEVSGIFFWIGIDQFYSYNGMVQPLNNEANINFFFANIDLNNAQKVWGTKVGQYNEVWWHWPNKNLPNYSGECNAVLIYNYKDQCWYDSAFPVTSNLPQAGRVCGTEITSFNYPIWVDAYSQPDFTPRSTLNPASKFWFMWLHENASDMAAPGLRVNYQPPLSNIFRLLSQKFSIPSFITSRYISFLKENNDSQNHSSNI